MPRWVNRKQALLNGSGLQQPLNKICKDIYEFKVLDRTTAKLFAKAKAKVIVADFNVEKIQVVTKTIIDEGGEAAFVKVDISKSEEVKAMVKFAVDTYGKLDVAVNNAAITPDDKPAAEFDEEYWNRLFSIDLTGTALCMKYELQQMLKQGAGGSIINISSVSALLTLLHLVQLNTNAKRCS